MRVLSIGNSFSGNAQRYLHRLAKHNGVDMCTVNLFIGGCSLRTHYLNMLDDRYDYAYFFNGENTGLKVSIRQVLRSDSWNVITLQQASPNSPHSASYSPYIEELAAYVRKYCPHSKIVLHETWAYAEGSDRLINGMHFEKAEDMLKGIRESYKKAAELISADGIIPCGEAMLAAEKAGLCVHQDTAHASDGIGSYLLGLAWLKYLTGKDISNDTFSGFAAPVSEEERAIIIRAVNETVTETLAW